MFTKNELKYYSSLLLKKFRDEENKFIIEGKKISEEALNSSYQIEIAFYTHKFFRKERGIIKKLTIKNIRQELLKEEEFSKISDTQNPQGIALVLKKKKLKNDIPTDANFIIGLENISDPGNLGTIIRNCDWFGINNIILNENCAEIYNPKVLRSTMGSIFNVAIFEKFNLYLTLEKLKNSKFTILSTDLNGENIFASQFPEKSVVIFSNEANGPSKKLNELADKKITIPRVGKAESLNVASACSIVLAEIFKQHFL
ncbi:MAG: RNA methyltransferase [Ignavibacteriales bacterium]|nr:RNA methyltransferase [Ignavibacteriales bacterium]